MTGAAYVLRYFFDPGSGTCLWAANDAARERFGYPVEPGDLPLSAGARERLGAVLAWYDRSLDWDDPGGESPWDGAEAARFAAAAQEFLAVLRRELGAGFELRDESGTAEGRDDDHEPAP